MDDYIHAKQRLLTGQQAGDSAVLNTFDPELAAWSRSEVPGQGESLIRGRQVPPVPLDRLPPLQVPGYHNRINAACAAAAALASGCSEASVYKGLAEFVGLPQRLERFAVIGGRSFYNDSTSTTPESTVAALDALEGPVWLLAGGKDKGFDFAAMIEAVGRHALGAAFFGTVAPQLRRALAARFPEIPAVAVETMEEALEWCWQHSKPTETILLSPGCSSHDQFQNFRHRGECFVQAVSKLALSGPLML